MTSHRVPSRKAPVPTRAATPSRARWWSIVAGVAVLAFAVRAAVVLQSRRAPFFLHLLGDAQGYDEWARRVAAGDWLGSGVFYQAPLYPYLVGSFYASFGRDLLALRLAQAALGALACILIMLAAARWFDRRTGLAAGLLLALYAPALFFDTLIQKAVLDGLLVSGIVLSLAAASKNGWWWRSALAGILLGLLSLNRENAVVLVPIAALWTWRRTQRRPAPLVLVALTALVLSPVAIRNAVVGGEFHLTTSQLGPNFYIGNNPQATGTYVPLRPERGSFEFERQDATDLAEAASGRRLGPSEVSGYWLRKGLAWIGSNPGAWVRLVGRKVMLFLNRTEAADTEDLGTHAEYSAVLAVAARGLHFGILAPLAALGLFVTRRRWRELWALYALGAVFALSVVAFFVLDRYRYPVVPLLTVFAAAGLTRGWGFWQSQPGGERARMAGVVFAMLVAANWPMLSTPTMGALTRANIAAALHRDGLDADAEAEYRKALEHDPHLAVAHSNLGSLLLARGEHAEALAQCQEAARLNPASPTALMNLGVALGALGRTTEAVEAFRQAVRIDPADADAQANLGRAFAVLGQSELAIQHLREAVRLQPSAAQPHNDLGVLLCSQGLLPEGITHLEAAVRLDPRSAELAANLEHARQLAGQRR